MSPSTPHTPPDASQFGRDRFGVKPPSHTANWIISYADMMTILLTFMILLLSISTIAQTRYDLLVSALTGRKTGNLSEVQQKIDDVVKTTGMGGEVRTNLDERGLTVEFSNALLFESGQAELRPGAVEILAPIAQHIVQDLEPGYGLVIEGYTDDVPITSGKFGSNWELSTSRAIHVMTRLLNAGLDRRRISVQGFADTRAATEVDLLDQASTAQMSPEALLATRAANRRVVIRIDSLDADVAARLQAQSPPQDAPTAPAPTVAPLPAAPIAPAAPKAPAAPAPGPDARKDRP